MHVQFESPLLCLAHWAAQPLLSNEHASCLKHVCIRRNDNAVFLPILTGTVLRGLGHVFSEVSTRSALPFMHHATAFARDSLWPDNDGTLVIQWLDGTVNDPTHRLLMNEPITGSTKTFQSLPTKCPENAEGFVFFFIGRHFHASFFTRAFMTTIEKWMRFGQHYYCWVLKNKNSNWTRNLQQTYYSSLHQQFTQCTDIKPPKTQHLQIAHVTYNASTPACTFVRLAGVSASLFRFIFFVTTYNHWLM